MRLGRPGNEAREPGNEVREPGNEVREPGNEVREAWGYVHTKQMLVELEDEETMNDTP